MGFTHYYEVHENGIPSAAWAAICKDVKTLLANLPERSTSAGGGYALDRLQIALEDDQPNKPPQISAARICFNGVDGGKNLGHETFILERKPKHPDWVTDRPMIFSFCKTARKPYDLPVCGVLILASLHAGSALKVSSDGDLGDWLPALKWVAGLFPEPIYSGRMDGLAQLFSLGHAPSSIAGLADFIEWARVTARLDPMPAA